ncbi:hypothetical protein Tco_0535919 [Tanacetum coccineum]
MLAIFHDMIEESVEVFMDDFSVFGNSFNTCLNNLDKMLQRCKDAHLVLNWEKCHFMVKEGIVLGHKVSSAGLEVDKAKINVISKLPPPTNIKGNIMDGVDIEDLTIEQYLRLTQESHAQKQIKNMTIFEYLEYDKIMNKNHISNAKSYPPTYFRESTPTHDPILEFAHYFDPNQPGTESDYDSEDMEEEVEYITDNEVVINEQKENNHGQEMKENIMKMQFEASTASIGDDVSSIASNEVDKEDDNTSNTAPYRLPKELRPGGFLLPLYINNHSFYATTTLDAKDNIIPQGVYECLGLDKLRGRPFLESTHAQIDVFNEEISFEIGSKKLKFNIDSYQSIEKIYMVSFEQEEETFNPLEIGIDPFSYESLAWLEFEQRTRSYVHVTYDDGSGEDYRMWPTCDPDLKFCFGYNEVFGVNEQGTLRLCICFHDHERRVVKGSYMGFADFLQVRYGQQKTDDTTRERREIGNPYSRRFDEYNIVFNNDIEHLSNEYILLIGKKGYVLDDVWEKCQQNYKKTNEAWHDEGYEEDEMWRSGDEKTDYNPLMLTLKLLK